MIIKMSFISLSTLSLLSVCIINVSTPHYKVCNMTVLHCPVT